MEKRIENLEALAQEARDFIAGLKPRSEGATLITLSGELGAGKTAFTKEVAKVLGVEEVVTSPTFVLEKVYVLPPQAGHGMSGFTRLVHIDAYRLESVADLAPLDFDELMRSKGNLVLLEWPEMVVDALPLAHVAITLAVLPDGAHTISYSE